MLIGRRAAAHIPTPSIPPICVLIYIPAPNLASFHLILWFQALVRASGSKRLRASRRAYCTHGSSGAVASLAAPKRGHLSAILAGDPVRSRANPRDPRAIPRRFVCCCAIPRDPTPHPPRPLLSPHPKPHSPPPPHNPLNPHPILCSIPTPSSAQSPPHNPLNPHPGRRSERFLSNAWIRSTA